MGIDKDYKKIIKSHKEDWAAISADPSLDEGFIREFADKVVWRIIAEKQDLSESFIEANIDRFNDPATGSLDLTAILTKQKLSENFLRKYADKFKWSDWKVLSSCQKLSEKFILDFENKVNWSDITAGQELSEKFIEEHQDKIKWEYVARYQTITEEFFWKHQDKIDVNFLVKSQKVDTKRWSAKFQELKEKEALKAEVLY